MYFLNIIISSLFLFSSICFARAFKCQFNPSTVLNAFWFVFTVFPLLLFPEIDVNPAALIVIFISVIIFSLTSFLFSWQIKKKSCPKINVNKLIRLLKWSALISVLFSILDLYIQGFSLQKLLTNLLVTSNEYLKMRYEGIIRLNIYSQIANILSYAAVIYGGYIYGKRQTFTILLYSFFPTIAITLIKGSKGAFVLSLIFFLGAKALNNISSNDKVFLSLKKLKFFILPGLLSLFIVLVAFLSKAGDSLDFYQAKDYLLGYLSRYSSTHLFAFSDWYTFNIGENSQFTYTDRNYPPGFLTFMSIFQLFGNDLYVPPGYYSEYYQVGLVKGNIYTIFRGLITDFTLFGNFIFWFFFGSISHFIYRKVRFAQDNFALTLYPIIIGFIYSTPLISLFVWKSTLLLPILIYTGFYISSTSFKLK